MLLNSELRKHCYVQGLRSANIVKKSIIYKRMLPFYRLGVLLAQNILVFRNFNYHFVTNLAEGCFIIFA